MGIVIIYIIVGLFIISGVLRCLGWFLGNKQKQSKEKLSPFECGFDNNPVYRFPLSLRFFIITVLFLLFDIEIVLLLPLPVTYGLLRNFVLLVLVRLFILLLVGGLYFEWLQGSLEWN